MSVRAVVIALVVIALAAGLWAAFGRGTSELTRLVPAWQLIPAASCEAESLVDPVMSWAPDSRSLLFSTASAKGYRPSILHWNVGDKRAERVVYGVSPNYVNNDIFLFLRQSPKSVCGHSLSTGAERNMVPNLNKVDLFREVTGFSYIAARKTVQLRVSYLTQFYEPGCQEIDFTGKSLGNVARTTGDAVLDRGVDPKGARSAVIFDDPAQETRELRIAAPGEENKSKPVASGNLGAVAWSPDGQLVAFGDSNEVRLLKLGDMKIITVARFGAQPESGAGPCVSRLAWSPNGSYLAALDVIPAESISNAVLYVLDMTKIR
jgi:WD40 repeat protein